MQDWRRRSHDEQIQAAMFGDGFEQATILRTGPDGTRVIVRSSWAERESLLVGAREAELVVVPAVR